MPEQNREEKAKRMTLDEHERQAAIAQEGKNLTGREDRDADQRTQ